MFHFGITKNFFTNHVLRFALSAILFCSVLCRVPPIFSEAPPQWRDFHNELKLFLLIFFTVLVIYTMCGILHVKTSCVKSVSTWRLVFCESCRCILSYTTLVGPRHRSERSWYLTKQKHLTMNGLKFLEYLKSHSLFHSRLGLFGSLL